MLKTLFCKLGICRQLKIVTARVGLFLWTQKERLEVVAKYRRRLSVVLKIFVLLKSVKMVSVERVKWSMKKKKNRSWFGRGREGGNLLSLITFTV